ncbi:hypothetical protein ACHAW6_016036 [Cyclotella cf. meneghiniana]
MPSLITELELGVFKSSSCQRKMHRQGVLMTAVKDVKRSYYENDDDENPKHADDDLEIDDKGGADEDDFEADEYLEQLISNAMKEEEPGTILTEQKRIAKPINLSQSDLNPNSSTFGGNDSALQETMRMMEQQQQQIDLLMKLVQNQQLAPQSDTSHLSSSSSTTKQKSINVTPLKVMLFIDGTWLYYSLHARKLNRCSIIPKFGKGWQANYKVDWMALPRLVCRQIEEQRNSETSFKGSDRPLEITRVMVFTSAKKETDPNSIRMRMFREMANANYDVHMMETVGKGEKCVDIQLAVEMLHYATVPNAYDMAVLLSGDKDFVPALVRTRQKGKEVVICSMKSGCNRVLYESPHIRDYNVIWLEDCLDELIVPIPEDERGRFDRASYASVFTILRVIRDYVEAAPKDIEWVSSRDIGMYLKSVKIADSNMLEELKQSQGGLRNFLMERARNIFDVQIPSDMGKQSDHSFGVRVKGDSDQHLVDEFKRTQFFTKEEKEFLENYRKDNYLTNAEYSHTKFTSDEDYLILPAYSNMTVSELKEICRERHLPVSGKKDVLIQRLEQEDKNLAQVAPKRKRDEWKEAPRKTIPRRNTPNNVYADSLPQLDLSQKRSAPGDTIDHKVTAHLEALVKEYLQASGGVASSRDVGRYLAANSDSHKGKRSALSELKDAYGSLLAFIHSRNLFSVENDIPRAQSSSDGFPIKLNNKVKR